MVRHVDTHVPSHTQREVAVATDVPSAVLSRNLANAAVALAEALGSRTAAMPATQSLIIRGPKVSRLVEVLRLLVQLNPRYESCVITPKPDKTWLNHKTLIRIREISTSLVVYSVLGPPTRNNVLDSRK